MQDHARNELAAAWLQAEKLHPILAAYRQDKALERVDLYGISFENDDAMRNVMLHLLRPWETSWRRSAGSGRASSTR